MGTSAKNAGSQENFIKIDREYVEPFFDHLDNIFFSPPFSGIAYFSYGGFFFQVRRECCKVCKGRQGPTFDLCLCTLLTRTPLT